MLLETVVAQELAGFDNFVREGNKLLTTPDQLALDVDDQWKPA
jgi:hypothetical protein